MYHTECAGGNVIDVRADFNSVLDMLSAVMDIKESLPDISRMIWADDESSFVYEMPNTRCWDWLMRSGISIMKNGRWCCLVLLSGANQA